ncbi:hypothetical protein [Pseudomonas sichuanensis]
MKFKPFVLVYRTSGQPQAKYRAYQELAEHLNDDAMATLSVKARPRLTF